MAVPPGPRAPVYDAGGGVPQPAIGIFTLDASGNIISVASPGSAWTVVTPSDSTILTGLQYLRIGVAGNLAIKAPSGGATVTIPVTAGEYVPFSGGIVMSTGTTATGIVAIA